MWHIIWTTYCHSASDMAVNLWGSPFDSSTIITRITTRTGRHPVVASAFVSLERIRNRDSKFNCAWGLKPNRPNNQRKTITPVT